MRKIRHISGVLVMLTALVCAAMAATQLTLFAHLATSHPSEKHHHEHDCDNETPHSQPHENCPTCQLLLGPGGKCILLSDVPFILTATPALLTRDVDSRFHHQHNTIAFPVRGPPVS